MFDFFDSSKLLFQYKLVHCKLSQKSNTNEMFQKIILIWSFHSQKLDIDIQVLVCLESLKYFL